MKILASLFLIIAFAACNQSAKDPEAKQVTSIQATADTSTSGVYFANLKNGDKVHSPVMIEMGVRGMVVEPAGKVEEGKGHHHLIIDGSFVEQGQPVPEDATHIHFGKGQTAYAAELYPGKHTLTLQFANGLHQSYGQDWSHTISITVEK
ncbi:MAG TPA: DUF4399 domain-containing protein [Bacteroidia bacterium]|jgi:hypothetical protein|nr:DUF4399 domain-containing protein [Bacteroidia bacterium]